MARIGFIGLGNMGLPMAGNLVLAGHEVHGHDISDVQLRAAVEAGMTAAPNIAEAASGADVIITMLPAGSHVRAAYCDDGGVLSAASDGALAIDCSTIDVATARDVIAAAADKGVAMVDAPVSGGVAGAAAGTLTFMVGGTAEAFARAQPILDPMGKAVIHAGDAGAGQAAKICNNLMLGIQMISVCEAFNLAEKLGLDAQTLYDISSNATGQCWSLNKYCPKPGPVAESPANKDYKPGFAATMMLKDLKLGQDAAASVGVSTPLAAEATALYQAFCDDDDLGRDFSGIIQWLRDRRRNGA